ncbi:inorganic diphosphatase [Candidatus Shapirobacteria bacterium]|nr:inorganic diphosphatase [Candidatus Shapirobacteria bacterium]
MKNLPAGPKPPQDIYCVVEIPRGSSNKYEFDDKLNTFVLDRVLYGAVFFPTEYGYIPSTIGEDGDPLDIMVITTYPTFPGCVLESSVAAALKITDTGKLDYKIIALAKNDPRLDKITDLKSLPPHFKKEVEDFWGSYARLQPKKKIVVGNWLDKRKALKIVKESIDRFKQKK